MPFRKASHSGEVDEPSTSQETLTAQTGAGLHRNELYYDMVMRFLRRTSGTRLRIAQRYKIGAGVGMDRPGEPLKLENPFEELERRVMGEVMQSVQNRSPRRSSRQRNRDQTQASPSRLSPIEVKVEDPSAPTVPPGTSHSLLSVNTTESNVEKAAKQEAQVMARIAELRRAGLWTASRLPLCVEPPRNKTHWDYVLEEVKWMATDFRMERHFKRNIARKIAAAIQKQKKEDETDQERAHARLIRDGKRICASIAKMIRDFWQTVDKVVEHRAQEILESKKRKALDAHMAFIVGEADKLSSMVQEGLAQDKGSKTPSMTSRDDENGGDADFCVSESESDDEITIEREEAAMKERHEDVREEVSALNKDADKDMDDFLASLPPEYLASLGLQLPSSNTTVSSESLADSEGEDDNKTLQEIQLAAKSEKARKLSEEGIEESRAKRPKLEEASDEDSKSGRSNDVPPATRSGEAHKNEEEEEMSVDEEDSEVAEDQNGNLEGNGDGRGMLESVDYAKLNSVNSDERQQELANIAEAALKFQPKGFTLETTQVKTAVPFLIRGTLREYQMVGLDWLVTLYEKNLNGLGKTIQTISLLAHLACCESIWGPHLIVVPTSVILNWEMELKKWCPAFKILTYFGTQKDRAEKRKGWSKPNAFHVCITSYKTVTTDIRAFKMKSWQYLILDEAQNIKNWKSQRWQALLNVKARRRLLLTGTPLQNSLMELWSLMHFLMPAIFASHDDFKDWFSNPLTGMMDGSVEFNAPLVQQLHKVLRPFILRRLKSEVEKQLPKKTEHVIKCPLSKRQRYLYDDFMSQRSTRDNLKSGNMLSVLNIVMQLRKCCNHPNLFEPRAVQSPLCLHQLRFSCPGLVLDLDEKEFGRDLPEFFDLRKRFTGISSSAVGRAPLIEELAELNDSRPPVVPGFRLHRPIASGTTIPTNAQSSEIASVVDVSAAELQRAGFAQNEMVLVVRDGDDIESILGSSTGAPVPMRVRVDDGRLVLDSDGLKQGKGAKLCQVVTGVNGEKTLQEVTSRTGEQQSGGNAPVPVSQVANPAPPAMAAMPGRAASTASMTSNIDANKTERIPYGETTNKSSVHVHPFLRCSTALSKVAPLTVSTATVGFHHSMQNGGTHDYNDYIESIEELSARLSPPLKKRRTDLSEKQLVSGEFAELVPVEVLQRMEENNRLRLRRIIERFECQQNPMYSTQLISMLQKSILSKLFPTIGDGKTDDAGYLEISSAASLDIQDSLISWAEDTMKRFWIWVNPAVTDAPSLWSSSSGHGSYVRIMNEQLSMASRELLSMTHPLTHIALVSSQLQFPELRLIEYDCGKLQALARLLRRLYVNKHRCLIFTQMSRMLDVLQAFLSYHGYQYFRLDGTTGIEQRQAMMERFNADTKIFCFILSTRSGGVGVNLTGADTVIFYDSDWNPTMDAQAQDRCHRIGQTRNVTIFRLISERTIEENILRKAIQKRRLGEMAIDDAGFTPEFFKQSDNIRDLFDGTVDVSDIAVSEGPKSQKDVEKAMAALEDEQDVTAAKMLIAETRADKAEFDESKNVNTSENSVSVFQSHLDNEEPLDEKYIELISQLKPIERYAVNFLEAEYKPEFEEEVREAEALIEQKREDWVRAHNKALSNEDTEPAADEDSSRVDDDFYGAGLLLDEVRSRRKNRVSTSTGTVSAKVVPSRHSERLSVPHHKSISPRKTLSGRRIVAPKSFSSPNISSSTRNLRSGSSLSPVKSSAQTAARSAVRRAAARVVATTVSATPSPTADSTRKSRARKKLASPPPSSSPPASPPNHEVAKRRSRKQEASKTTKDDTSSESHDSVPAKVVAKPQHSGTSQTSPQRPASKSANSPVSATKAPPLTSLAPSVCVRPSTIAGAVLTTPATSSPSSSSMPPSIVRPLNTLSVPSSPFKTNTSPQARFPVRTISRLSNQSSPLLASPSVQSSPVRLPVRILQTSPSISRHSSLNGPSVHHTSPLLVRRANITRSPVLTATSADRPQQRYVVVSRGTNNMSVVMPLRSSASSSNAIVRPTSAPMPVRRLIVQPRSSAVPAQSPRLIQRPGLGEYERPRLQFRASRPGGASQPDGSPSSLGQQ
ncbi:prevent-host-death family protein [Necator americanus]|uniref:Prevent-host-death family protein n=1 Tax=Necator americanus TaxID=51031 RepID=W2SQM5_NECAM|nr:prevent-host-death family protein [Necator americanus]ETN71176.1 prevent-host-death family protein [Necator americanus]